MKLPGHQSKSRFYCRIRFDRQDRDSDSLDKNRLERQNYSVSHNGRWDYGTSELKYYGAKVENKTLATAAR
ncbi:hypothetical protein ACVXHA_15870 [Escherichia coli]